MGDELEFWKPSEIISQPWTGQERCGFVIKVLPGAPEWNKSMASGPGNPFQYHPEDSYFLELKNVSSDPENFFEMSADAVSRVRTTEAWEIIGIWHTHPPGLPQPSEVDMEWMPKKWPFFIICDSTLYTYEPSSEGS